MNPEQEGREVSVRVLLGQGRELEMKAAAGIAKQIEGEVFAEYLREANKERKTGEEEEAQVTVDLSKLTESIDSEEARYLVHYIASHSAEEKADLSKSFKSYGEYKKFV